MLFVVPIIRVLKFIIQNAGHCGVGDLLLDHSVIKIAKMSETKEALVILIRDFLVSQSNIIPPNHPQKV